MNGEFVLLSVFCLPQNDVGAEKGFNFNQIIQKYEHENIDPRPTQHRAPQNKDISICKRKEGEVLTGEQRSPSCPPRACIFPAPRLVQDEKVSGERSHLELMTQARRNSNLIGPPKPSLASVYPLAVRLGS